MKYNKCALELLLSKYKVDPWILIFLMNWLLLISFNAIYDTSIAYNMPLMEKTLIKKKSQTNGGLHFASTRWFSWKSRRLISAA